MNTGQMMLVIAALALLSTIALSVNSTLLDNDQLALESQAGIMAVSICEAQIEDLAMTQFDSLVVGVSLDTLQTPFDTFICSTNTGYVLASAPDNLVVGPTSYKQVSVTVTNTYMLGGITLKSIVGDY